MLQRTMTGEDKIAIFERYKADDISEDAARLLLTDDFEALQEDCEAFCAAAEDDTSQYLV